MKPMKKNNIEQNLQDKQDNYAVAILSGAKNLDPSVITVR